MRNGLLAALLFATLSSTALAARPAMDDDAPPPDARTEGFHKPDVNGAPEPLLIEPASGSAGTWAITVICAAICLGVLFKNGKRTHLD